MVSVRGQRRQASGDVLNMKVNPVGSAFGWLRFRVQMGVQSRVEHRVGLQKELNEHMELLGRVIHPFGDLFLQLCRLRDPRSTMQTAGGNIGERTGIGTIRASLMTATISVSWITIESHRSLTILTASLEYQDSHSRCSDVWPTWNWSAPVFLAIGTHVRLASMGSWSMSFMARWPWLHRSSSERDTILQSTEVSYAGRGPSCAIRGRTHMTVK